NTGRYSIVVGVLKPRENANRMILGDIKQYSTSRPRMSAEIPPGNSSTITTARSNCCSSSIHWEWMTREAFGASLPGSATQFVEPPWKMILSNKGILPLLWEMYPDHPTLLPAYFDDDPKAATLGASYARKPLYSREGANIELIRNGRAVEGRRTLRGGGLRATGD